MKGAKGSSAGGAYSTTEDLFKFAIALKNNILISEESLKLMVADENRDSYGYGFSLNKFNEIPENMIAVHLWNEVWRRHGMDKNKTYHPESLYEQLKKKHGI